VFREHIEHHYGQVTDMAGDSVLAVFPSALEAVQCAVGVQAEISKMNAASTPDKRMLFRIGCR
jgi:adenylate cyclase